MDETHIQRAFFRPICNPSEIDRIFNVKTAKDHLLKLRAETIVDHMRLFRVYRNKALRNERKWALEASFNDAHYRAVLKALPPPARRVCKQVTYGDIFTNDPNGMIFPTQYGPITTISKSLRFFLKFAHLPLLKLEDAVPNHVKLNGLRIAIRVMLQTEALDFDMDPRGILPDKIAETIHEPIDLQMQFIAGHEFSHFVLGHLSDRNLVDDFVFRAISKKDEEYKPIRVYNRSQQNEFEADLNAISLPDYASEKQGELLCAALLWFGCLELYQFVCEILSPKNPWAYRTHPTARERYENLLTNFPTPKGFPTQNWANFPRLLERLKLFLQEDVTINPDLYETYGSVYLDKPNTEWRGRELIDRVDYYWACG